MLPGSTKLVVCFFFCAWAKHKRPNCVCNRSRTCVCVCRIPLSHTVQQQLVALIKQWARPFDTLDISFKNTQSLCPLRHFDAVFLNIFSLSSQRRSFFFRSARIQCGGFYLLVCVSFVFDVLDFIACKIQCPKFGFLFVRRAQLREETEKNTRWRTICELSSEFVSTIIVAASGTKRWTAECYVT